MHLYSSKLNFLTSVVWLTPDFKLIVLPGFEQRVRETVPG